MKLHSFFNSSASYRVRIALNLKGIEWVTLPVNLRSGEQNSTQFKSLNPAGMVPTLEHGNLKLSQSLAIIDYLDQAFPNPVLIPKKMEDRQKVLEISLLIACEIHPLNNVRVLKYLTGPLKLSEEIKNQWYEHWILEGFNLLEKILTTSSNSGFCVGSSPTMADCFLIPQVANAKRMNINLDDYPHIMSINDHCLKLEEFKKASPSNQPDYQAP